MVIALLSGFSFVHDNDDDGVVVVAVVDADADVDEAVEKQLSICVSFCWKSTFIVLRQRTPRGCKSERI